MRSYLGTRARETKTPVPYASRYATGGYGGGLLAPSGADAQMKAMGSNETLFGIVDAYATAVAAAEWHLYEKLPPGSPPGAERRIVTPHAAADLWDNPTGPGGPYSQDRLVKTFTQHKELVGEGIVVVVKLGSLPYELWPVAPHKMEPVRHPSKFITGWVYHADDGQRVPLDVDQVIQMVQTPCPWDPYRGIGAVQTVLGRLYGAEYAVRWQQQFFRNSARPGGVIKVPNSLSDDEFRRFRDRWREAHQGVDNAGRVAILEGAEWQDISYSMNDMQFVELQEATHEHIRVPYRIPDTILGRGESLNRATAEAQLFQFALWHVVPRLENILGEFLNYRLLPMYGGTARGYEFGYVSPVPEDREAWARDVVAQSTAYLNFTRAGVAGDDGELLRHLRLPAMKATPPPEPAPVAAPGRGAVPAGKDEDARALPAARTSNGHTHTRVRLAFGRAPARALPRAAAGDDGGSGEEQDRSGILADVDTALERLLEDWRPGLDEQIDDLTRQVEQAVDAGDVAALAALTAASERHAALLRRRLDTLATTAGERMSEELGEYGEGVGQPELDDGELSGIAEAAAALIAADLAASAGREALRLFRAGVAGVVVADQVAAFLRSLAGDYRRTQLGAALHWVVNMVRLAMAAEATRRHPGGRIVAFEQNDHNTCRPCSEVNGTVFATAADAYAAYGGGVYHACLGKWRCRGTVIGLWS